jgi:uncharacterized protein YkwD
MLFSGLALAVMPGGAAASAGCAHADSSADTASAPDLAAATLCLVNAERAAAGQRPLTMHGTLARTAQVYASEMVATAHFAHSDTNGGNVADRVQSVGGSLDPWLELGENLGWGTLDQATPRALVAGWMNSPTHRDNILFARFNRLGVGIANGAPAEGQTGGQTYVAVFGQVASRKPARPKRCSRAKTRKARACRARARARR